MKFDTQLPSCDEDGDPDHTRIQEWMSNEVKKQDWDRSVLVVLDRRDSTQHKGLRLVAISTSYIDGTMVGETLYSFEKCDAPGQCFIAIPLSAVQAVYT